MDGKNINCEIMYGTSINRAVQCKLNTCSNKDFNFDMDKGVKRRGLVQLYESKFIDQDEKKSKKDDSKNHIYIKDIEYSQKFENEEYKNAYLKLLLDHYDFNFIVPKTNIKLFSDIANEYDEIGNILTNNFSITDFDSDLVHKDSMLSIFKDKLNRQNLSWRYLLSELKTKGIKYDRLKMSDNKRGYFIGIKKIQIEEDYDF